MDNKIMKIISKKIFFLAFLILQHSYAHEELKKPNFNEIKSDKLSPETQLALYKIHSHIKTCEISPLQKSQLSILWVYFNSEQLNLKNFTNFNAPDYMIKNLEKIYAEAAKSPNCDSPILTNKKEEKMSH